MSCYLANVEYRWSWYFVAVNVAAFYETENLPVMRQYTIYISIYFIAFNATMYACYNYKISSNHFFLKRKVGYILIDERKELFCEQDLPTLVPKFQHFFQLSTHHTKRPSAIIQNRKLLVNIMVNLCRLLALCCSLAITRAFIRIIDWVIAYKKIVKTRNATWLTSEISSGLSFSIRSMVFGSTWSWKQKIRNNPFWMNDGLSLLVWAAVPILTVNMNDEYSISTSTIDIIFS